MKYKERSENRYKRSHCSGLWLSRFRTLSAEKAISQYLNGLHNVRENITDRRAEQGQNDNHNHGY